MEGKRRRAWSGDVVDLTPEEIARGERAGVFGPPSHKAQPNDADTPSESRSDEGAEPVETEPDSDDVDPGPEVIDPPKRVSPKAEWIDYAVNGAPLEDRIPEDEAQAMTKAELVEMFG